MNESNNRAGKRSKAPIKLRIECLLDWMKDRKIQRQEKQSEQLQDKHESELLKLLTKKRKRK